MKAAAAARAKRPARTAPYPHFSNKEDIFRALSRTLHERAQLAAEAAAVQPGPLEARIEAMLAPAISAVG